MLKVTSSLNEKGILPTVMYEYFGIVYVPFAKELSAEHENAKQDV
jgi:hypothetical protein